MDHVGAARSRRRAHTGSWPQPTCTLLPSSVDHPHQSQAYHTLTNAHSAHTPFSRSAHAREAHRAHAFVFRDVLFPCQFVAHQLYSIGPQRVLGNRTHRCKQTSRKRGESRRHTVESPPTPRSTVSSLPRVRTPRTDGSHAPCAHSPHGSIFCPVYPWAYSPAALRRIMDGAMNQLRTQRLPALTGGLWWDFHPSRWGRMAQYACSGRCELICDGKRRHLTQDAPRPLRSPASVRLVKPVVINVATPPQPRRKRGYLNQRHPSPSPCKIPSDRPRRNLPTSSAFHLILGPCCSHVATALRLSGKTAVLRAMDQCGV
ncbi:hypothetical protein FA95DRAFT_854263 [Auriscalpium vulgare]|uniref:Uncharacterized protein n=1 Tax=Auriscalpium vulgare TaxID=40419 RepID=A0ACB8R8Z7_9AGAM|nr:hypothetical protein FA95DRAFT_854263 [Auriscalpium vulgare]